MKGLEGLPLKYILIVLVAALIIAAVVAVVSGWTDLLKTQGEKTTSTVAEGTSKQLCDTRESMGTCYAGTTASVNSTWTCNSTATNKLIAC